VDRTRHVSRVGAIAVLLPGLSSASPTSVIVDGAIGAGIEHRLAPCDGPGCTTLNAPATEAGIALGLGVSGRVTRDLIIGGRLSTMFTREYSSNGATGKTRGAILLGPSTRWFMHDTLWCGGGLGVGAVVGVFPGYDDGGSFKPAIGAELSAGYGFAVAPNHELQLSVTAMLLEPIDPDGVRSQQRLTVALAIGYQLGR
jgi:hypothetical protein